MSTPASQVEAIDAVERRDGFDWIVGHAGGLRATVHTARLLANVDAPVLVCGETGAGKEVFARAIHETGRHRDRPFVAINCGGLPRELLASELFGYVDGAFTGARRSGMIGKIEAADGGTLFLDEIAEMPLDLQPYLLRVLEGGEVYPLGSNRPRRVRFRLISACNRDLRVESVASRFRTDLFYRVSVTSLRIPALRDRLQDIPDLVTYFSRDASERHGVPIRRFTRDVLDAFTHYRWPGNLRELRNVVATMLLVAPHDIVDASVLPPELTATVPCPFEPRGLEGAERDAIDASLRTHHGNITQVARDLRIAKSTLYVKMRKYGLDATLHEARVGSN